MVLKSETLRVSWCYKLSEADLQTAGRKMKLAVGDPFSGFTARPRQDSAASFVSGRYHTTKVHLTPVIQYEQKLGRICVRVSPSCLEDIRKSSFYVSKMLGYHR